MNGAWHGSPKERRRDTHQHDLQGSITADLAKCRILPATVVGTSQHVVTAPYLVTTSECLVVARRSGRGNVSRRRLRPEGATVLREHARFDPERGRDTFEREDADDMAASMSAHDGQGGLRAEEAQGGVKRKIGIQQPRVGQFEHLADWAVRRPAV